MNSLCSNCSHPVDKNDVYCKHCGNKIQTSPGMPIVTKTGKESINIGVGNLPNANIHIGDKYEVGKKVEKPAYIGRKLSRQIRIGNIKPKASWLAITGIFGILGSFASMISAMFDIESFGASLLFSPVLLCIIGISMIMLILGIALQVQKFVNLSYTNWNIESSREGHLFITKIGGSCPKCGAELHLIETGPKNHKRTVIVCRRNPAQHRWGFDPTVLSDL
jgi:hypothetical protein